jgi:hypothetical protein
MKPRDAFGVIVRAAGFGFVLAGILDLWRIPVALLGLPIHSANQTDLVLTAAAYWIVLGLAVLVGASLIVRLVYGRDDSN